MNAAQVAKTKTKLSDEDQLFDSLVLSAFEFLEKAILEFASSAKFSTVHFAIAIELFLKARLMREHWSLLLDKPDQGDKAKFFRGEAITVKPEQTVDRLKDLAGVPLPQHARETFKAIAAHRNKMVHFVHSAEAAGAHAAAQIVAEQCKGWLELKNLLDNWPEFDGFRGRILAVGRKMEKHRTYLDAKFASMQNIFDEHRREGGLISNCPSCRFTSVLLSASVGSITTGKCAVCSYYGSEISVKCTNVDCGSIISFNAYEGSPKQCPSCEVCIDEEFLKDALYTGQPITYDNYFDALDINCPQCSGYHTGVEHHSIYVCIQCFDVSDDMGVCEYCSEGQIGGVPEFSFLTGCDFCDGSAGQLRDD